jgi:2-iminobutanoate/2-iminopropanoate deaminase
MRRISLLLVAMFICSPCYAQSDELNAYKKESFNYSEWAKGKFSEVTSVTNARRSLYLAGVGSEDEAARGAAKILYPGDMYAQCKYAWDKTHADIDDVVRVIRGFFATRRRPSRSTRRP